MCFSLLKAYNMHFNFFTASLGFRRSILSLQICYFILRNLGNILWTFISLPYNLVFNSLCSYDVRSGVASHWKNKAALGSRATFHAERSTLSLQRVTTKDASTYTCRIDFRTNPTLTYTVNLTVTGKLSVTNSMIL